MLSLNRGEGGTSCILPLRPTNTISSSSESSSGFSDFSRSSSTFPKLCTKTRTCSSKSFSKPFAAFAFFQLLSQLLWHLTLTLILLLRSLHRPHLLSFLHLGSCLGILVPQRSEIVRHCVSGMSWMDLPITRKWRLSPRIVQETVYMQSSESEDSHHVSLQAHDTNRSPHCLRRRLPSLPLRRASRRFKLSRRTGSRRDRYPSLRSSSTLFGSSMSMASVTDVPWMPWAWSSRDTAAKDCVACSVQASILTGCEDATGPVAKMAIVRSH